MTPRLARWSLVVAATEILVAAYGLINDPAALGSGGYLALAGVAVAQALCVAAARRGPLSIGVASPAAVRIGVAVGVTAGLLYGVEGLAEYLSASVTDASVAIGWVIVAGLVASNVIAAAIATARLRSLRGGFAAAAYNAITEYLVWYPSVLICYYVFRDSPVTGRVWRAEGTYDDFARSGMTNLRAFVLQDFWGAGFFHLIAGLVLAGIFGTATAAVVRAGQRRAAGAGTQAIETDS